MNHSLIQILIICAYIGVLFLISGYVKMRSAGCSENYVLAGRKMTTPHYGVHYRACRGWRVHHRGG